MTAFTYVAASVLVTLVAYCCWRLLSLQRRCDLLLTYAPTATHFLLSTGQCRWLLVKLFGYRERPSADWGSLTYAWYAQELGMVNFNTRTERGPSGVASSNPIEIVLLLGSTEELTVWTGCEPEQADFLKLVA